MDRTSRSAVSALSSWESMGIAAWKAGSALLRQFIDGLRHAVAYLQAAQQDDESAAGGTGRRMARLPVWRRAS